MDKDDATKTNGFMSSREMNIQMKSKNLKIPVDELLDGPWGAKEYRMWNQTWEQKEFPKDYNKNRLKTLCERIVQVRSDLGVDDS